MEIEIKSVSIDNQAIHPTLNVVLDLNLVEGSEIITSISGRLQTGDGKTVALLNEYNNSSTLHYGLNSSSEPDRQKIIYPAALNTILSAEAINHIESLREKNIDKTVFLYFLVLVKYLKPSVQNNSGRLINQVIEQYNLEFKIEQSTWIRDFAASLRIGNFLLLELQLPEGKEISDFWQVLYSTLVLNLQDMQRNLRTGEWQQVLESARKFFEAAKIGDKNKSGHEKFRIELDKLMKRDQHDNEGIQNFHDAIWKLYEFISKYIHEKNKDGNFKPRPNAAKEDAYFAYCLAIGLLNLIGSKIS